MKMLISFLLAFLMALLGGYGAPDDQPPEFPAAHTHDIGETKDVDFTAWDGTAITTAGTYNLYLETDLTTGTQLVFGNLKTETNITVNLCLNGKNWTSYARTAVIGDGVTLNICNCQNAESTITGKGDPFTTRGGTFQVNFAGELNVYENVNLTCDNSEGRVLYGGVVHLMGRMGIYGATITGCKVDRVAIDNGSADITTGQGGAISVNSGAWLYMQDGLITGGTACTGGNVRMETGSSFTMDGGKITGGYSRYYVFNGTPSGGNAGGVFVEGATFIMKGGEISGNMCDGKGGGVIANSAAVVELYGDAKIINNESLHTEFGGGLHINNAKCIVSVSGTPTVGGNRNASGISNVYTVGNHDITVNQNVTGSQGTDSPAAHTHDVGTTKGVVFKAWNGGSVTTAGTHNLYLQNDLHSGSQVVFGDLTSEKNITVNLCLNGKNWTSDVRAAVICDGVTLNICNCQSAESTITGKGDIYSIRGGTFQVNPSGTLNAYENVNITCNNSLGRVVYAGVVDLKGKMGIYGATITGCSVKRIADGSGAADLTTGQGGAIAVNAGAELYMKDGLITGGTACTGGNVRMETGSTFTMDGGKITGGYAKYYIFNGATSGGNGGGVFVENAVFLMSGGEISGNKCDGKGGGVILNTAAVIELYGDARIINNQSFHTENAGGLHINTSRCTVAISGAPTVYGNTNASGKSNLRLFAKDYRILIGNMNDSAKIGVCVAENAVGVITDKKSLLACFLADKDAFRIVANADGTLSIAGK